MPSSLKAVCHTILSIIGLWLPTLISTNQWGTLTIGAVLTAILNFLLSYTIPTTTGASRMQSPKF